MNNYWHWTMAPLCAGISIILFGHHVPAIISPHHFTVIANWLTFGYGLVGWGVGILLGEGLQRITAAKKKKSS